MKNAYQNWKTDLEPYLTHYPLMSNKPGELPDGNAVLYSSIAILIHVKHFGVDDFTRQWVRDLYSNCKKYSGVITRGSHKFNDTQEHDDYFGLIAASVVTGIIGPALDIYHHGRENKWVYDEGVFKSKTSIGRWFENWYFRFPGFSFHAKIVVPNRIKLLDKILFCISFPFLRRLGGSGAQLRWVRYRAYKLVKESNFYLGDKVVSLWESRLRRDRPFLMGSVFQEYYGPDHVFTKWMQGQL